MTCRSTTPVRSRLITFYPPHSDWLLHVSLGELADEPAYSGVEGRLDGQSHMPFFSPYIMGDEACTGFARGP